MYVGIMMAMGEIDKMLDSIGLSGKSEEMQLFIGLVEELARSEPEKALRYFSKAIEILKIRNDELGMAMCFVSAGHIYESQRQFIKAIESLEPAIEVFDRMGRKKEQAYCLIETNFVYAEQGAYTRAMDCLMKAIRLMDEMNDRLGTARCLHGIGNVLVYNGDYEKALEYYKKALKIAREIDNPTGMCLCLEGIAIVNRYLGDFDKAIKYCRKALAIARKLGNNQYVSSLLNNLGTFYYKVGDDIKAMICYQEALEKCKNTNDKKVICECLHNMGLCLSRIGKPEDAKTKLQEALQIAKDINAIDLLPSIYRSLSTLYENQNDIGRAFECFRLYKEADDKLMNAKQGREIARIEVRHELDKKEKEVEIWKLASITDTLTKLLNRKGIIEKMENEIRNFWKNKKAFCIAISDIDHFKRFNDQFGHEYGDRVLCIVADILKSSARKMDYVARWGGEEFLLLLPNTKLEIGYRAVEKIRKKIEKYSELRDGKTISITISFGICEFDENMHLDDCIGRADAALYLAKQSGRNRTEISK